MPNVNTDPKADWINIALTGILPPFPNGGEQYMTWDGEWQQPAFFHEDWWEGQDSRTLNNITHWRNMYQNPIKWNN